MTVFIIEDEKMLLTALSKEFHARGWVVISAADGKEAIDTILTHPPMNVVVLDLVLPKVDGFEVLRQLKTDPVCKKIPVVVLTNLSDECTIAAIVAAGVKDYLVKADYQLKETVTKIIEIAQRPQLVISKLRQ